MSIKSIKKHIKKRDLQNTVEVMLQYIKQNKNPIHKLLLNDVFPYPLASPFDDTTFNFLVSVINQVKLSITDSDISIELSNLIDVMRLLGLYNKNIKDDLERLTYLSLPFNEQVRLIYCFLEYTHFRILFKSDVLMSENNTFANLFDYHSVQNKIDYFDDNLSFSDIDDIIIECAQIILGYLWFKKNDNKHAINYNAKMFSQIIEELGLLKLFNLASHRYYLDNAWEKYKYLNWNANYSYIDSKITYSFTPRDDEELFRNTIATKRYYHDLSNTLHNYGANMINKSTYFHITMKEVVSRINSLESILYIENNKFSILLDYHIELNNAEESYIKEFVGIDIKNISFGDSITYGSFKLFYNYIYTLGAIYMSFIEYQISIGSLLTIDKIVPTITMDIFISMAQKFTGMPESDILKCLDFYIFNFKNGDDLFNQPIMKFDNYIMFSSYLVTQINYIRLTERLAYRFKTLPQNSGFKFEETILNNLSKYDYLNVNLDKIKYTTSTGKEIEFDGVLVWEDYIVFIESKRIKRPYDPIEKMNAREEVAKAVSQLNMHHDSIKNEWNLFKNNCSIDLPAKFPGDNKIIKIVCLNVYEYTGMIIDNCYITDFRNLSRFWKNPIIYKDYYERNMFQKSEKYHVMWSGTKPTIEDFIRHLTNSFYIDGYYNKLNENYRINPLYNNLPSIILKEYILEKYPFNS